MLLLEMTLLYHVQPQTWAILPQMRKPNPWVWFILLIRNSNPVMCKLRSTYCVPGDERTREKGKRLTKIQE